MKAGSFISALSLLALCASAQTQEDHKGRVRTQCVLLYSKPVKKVIPIYPPLARQVRVQGRVTINCMIGADGSVKTIEVTKGHPLLIQAATDAVAQWKFKLPVLEGEKVSTSAKINFDFQLIEDKGN